MKTFFRWLLWIIGSIVGLLLILALILRLTEWTPSEVELCHSDDDVVEVALPDTITLLSWNIGYAGLGDDMDFFYDGGKTTRTTEQRTAQNLTAITTILQSYAQSVDFILLQEIDFDSKRSYNVDQYEHIEEALDGFTSVYALNYDTPFVPMPLSDPMGKVRSGLAIFSKYPIARADRYAYPGGFSFPVRLFNLKRCLLSAQIVAANGEILYLNNTHNTAYDTGGMRDAEMVFLNDYLTGKPLSITAGDWNSTPPGYVPSQKEVSNPNFSTISVRAEDFGREMTFAADLSGTPSARFGYEPYRKGQTTTTVIDFALLGEAFDLIDVQIVDLGFENSDHNPVVCRVARKVVNI